jgi:hypothetical protein
VGSVAICEGLDEKFMEVLVKPPIGIVRTFAKV